MDWKITYTIFILPSPMNYIDIYYDSKSFIQIYKHGSMKKNVYRHTNRKQVMVDAFKAQSCKN